VNYRQSATPDNTLPLITTNPHLAQVNILLLSGYSHRKGYRMRNIIVATLFFLLSSNAFACYDGSLSNRANFDNCLTEAEQGQAEAQYILGYMYSEGLGATQDYKEAANWYRKAAEQGHAKAQFNLGLMYSEGQGVTTDYKEAANWYRKAAEQGIAEAQSILGLMYSRGQGVTQDYKEAVKRYSKAAEQGFADAQNNLGAMYSQGQGVTQDYKSAHMWYSISAANGYSTAAKNRDLIAKEMTPSQIEKAQDMAREWMAKH